MTTIASLVTVILILSLANTAVLAYALLHDRRYRIDTSRIAGASAANLIDRYGDDINLLNEDGIKQAARVRYLELCGAFGLPETAVDAVISEVWTLVSAAQTSPQSAGVSLYE